VVTGVLVHVDVVLVDGVHDELVALWLHPGGDEGRQVEPRVAVQHQLVADDLVRRLLRDRPLRHPVPARAAPNPVISIPGKAYEFRASRRSSPRQLLAHVAARSRVELACESTMAAAAQKL
jgi:hypothetical protein